MKKSENVARVMSRGFESYFYFAQISRCGLDLEEQIFKAIHAVLYGKYIVQNFAVGVYDKAVMLVLCYVDSDINHNDTSQCVYLMLYESTGHFTSCNLVLY